MAKKKPKTEEKMIAKAKEMPPLEEMISLAEFARQLPQKPSFAAVHNWTTEGIKDVNGKRRKLATWLGTNGRMTTMEAYRSFLRALNGYE